MSIGSRCIEDQFNKGGIMPILPYIKLYVISLLIFIIVDLTWIAGIMKNFYQSQLGPLSRMTNGSMSPNIPSSILVWMLIVLGLILFVLPKIPKTGSGFEGVLWGALFGLILYGVYDLTNYALLKEWTLSMTIVDMLWGTVACGISGFIVGHLARWLL
jgi:uncharacterized membrane protein